MSGIHTNILTHAHSYTRSKTPWRLDEHKSVYGKLIHYLSGGGMQDPQVFIYDMFDFRRLVAALIVILAGIVVIAVSILGEFKETKKKK